MTRNLDLVHGLPGGAYLDVGWKAGQVHRSRRHDAAPTVARSDEQAALEGYPIIGTDVVTEETPDR